MMDKSLFLHCYGANHHETKVYLVDSNFSNSLFETEIPDKWYIVNHLRALSIDLRTGFEPIVDINIGNGLDIVEFTPPDFSLGGVSLVMPMGRGMDLTITSTLGLPHAEIKANTHRNTFGNYIDVIGWVQEFSLKWANNQKTELKLKSCVYENMPKGALYWVDNLPPWVDFVRCDIKNIREIGTDGVIDNA